MELAKLLILQLIKGQHNMIIGQLDLSLFKQEIKKACLILWCRSHSSPRLLFPKDLTPLLSFCPNSIQLRQPLLHLHSCHRLSIDYKLRPLWYSSEIGYLCAYSGISYWALPLVEPIDLSCQILVPTVFLSMLVAFLKRPKQLADHQPSLMRSTNFWFLRTSEETQYPIR